MVGVIRDSELSIDVKVSVNGLSLYTALHVGSAPGPFTGKAIEIMRGRMGGVF